MKKIILALILVLPNMALADEWLCSHPAVVQEGNTVKSCGIAVREHENEASEQAFILSQRSFARICNASAECPKHKITAVPKRTECKKVMGVFPDGSKKIAYECQRLIAWVMGE